jgi:hypothetical protein
MPHTILWGIEIPHKCCPTNMSNNRISQISRFHMDSFDMQMSKIPHKWSTHTHKTHTHTRARTHTHIHTHIYILE